MGRHSEITIEEGSTNVYADLGYADAAEMQRKSQLAAEIARAIKARHLTQAGAVPARSNWSLPDLPKAETRAARQSCASLGSRGAL